jgi:hypothetical protein
MRQIEVDHVTDVGHVNAPCRYVRRNEHAKDSPLKAVQRASAL